MSIQTILFGIAVFLGIAALVVGILGVLRGNSDLLPVAVGIFVVTGIVVVIALVLQNTQR